MSDMGPFTQDHVPLEELKAQEADAIRAAIKEELIANDYDVDGIHNDWYRIVDFVRYDPETGEIVENGNQPIAAINHRAETEAPWAFLMEKGDWQLQYVDVAKKKIKYKTACPAVLRGMNFSYLPVPCRVTIRDDAAIETPYDISESNLELSFRYPGVYTVTVTSPTCLPGEYKVEAP